MAESIVRERYQFRCKGCGCTWVESQNENHAEGCEVGASRGWTWPARVKAAESDDQAGGRT